MGLHKKYKQSEKQRTGMDKCLGIIFNVTISPWQHCLNAYERFDILLKEMFSRWEGSLHKKGKGRWKQDCKIL